MITKMPSSSAQDRQIAVWFQKIQNGEIKLPRFQRHQAWDKGRIQSLLQTITQNLPLGVTLILNVGDKEKFVSRFLATAPHTQEKVTEHLLDGQQRLTALWRSLHNNYDDVKFFMHVKEYDSYNDKTESDDEVSIWFTSRWKNKDSKLMPLWVDSPEKCFQRGLIPLELFRPGDIAKDIDEWIKLAIGPIDLANGNAEIAFKEWYEKKDALKSLIGGYRETISHFNLPYLALPAQTTKETALQVFINMNTNSKPLSQYDIIRAEIEGVKNISLDDLQAELHVTYPKVHHYFELPYLILASSALIQDKLPNQRGMWDMGKKELVDNWDTMANGLGKMADFMESQRVFDKERLPTNAVLAVIAALYTYIPESLDARGKAESLLKKYMWSSFFTDRYENSAASHAFNDFMALKNILICKKKEDQTAYTEGDVPVFNREKYPLASIEELMRVSWPKRENIRARAIMAVFSKLGAVDFADGSTLTREQLKQGKRHYHHIYPDALLKEADIESFLALNCAMITDKTNLNISRKEPYRYFKERLEWTDEEGVNERLNSHLIPIKEMKNGDYSNLSDQDRISKIKTDFSAFIQKRATYVARAVDLLTQGKEIFANEVIRSVDKTFSNE